GTPAPPPVNVQRRTPGALTRIIWAIIPPMRLVDGDRVIYRKHWIVLFGNLWKPTLAYILLAALIVSRWAAWFAPLQNVPDVVFWGIALVWFALNTFWWYWEYADWRDDLYMLDNQSIIDI